MHDNGHLSIKRFTIQNSRDLRKTPGISVYEHYRSEYRSLAVVLLNLGQSVLPLACFVASQSQQNMGVLKVAHPIYSNTMFGELKTLHPALTFKRPNIVSNFPLCYLSNTSHGGRYAIYRQPGVITGLKIDLKDGSRSMFHPISWYSHKHILCYYYYIGA